MSEPEPPRRWSSGVILIDEANVRRVLAARRVRDQLGPDLFSDPAWDLLLEAFAAWLGRKRVSIADLCSKSTVPATTASRWIEKLKQDGWLRPVGNGGGDGQWIELTPVGAIKLRRFFEDVGPSLFFA